MIILNYFDHHRNAIVILLSLFLRLLIFDANPAQTATTEITKFLRESRAASTDSEDDLLYKGWSGLRVNNSSLPMVYYHDLTIAVVEMGPDRILLNCELIEVFNDEQASNALRTLSKQLKTPFHLKFNEMFELMTLCDKLDPDRIQNLSQTTAGVSQNIKKNNDVSTTANSIANAILPGTKWCGKGDKAKNYFDLGTEKSIDMCCRKHDLCPTKIRGQMSRYNLTNKSPYTSSHCTCDDDFMECLKSDSGNMATFMANIYFDILSLPCIQDGDKGRKRFRKYRPFQ